jgi:HEAT repeat protein
MAAARLEERIDQEVRRPYQEELGRLREDLGRAANFALASTGYEWALE